MITFLLLYILVARSIRREARKRFDGSPALPYYTSQELGVMEERFSFHSGAWLLFGSRYFSKNGKPKALIVFFPGIGAGRNAYLRVIASLVNQGYLVYSFDYTGSMESESPWIYGLGHVNFDIRAFFSWLDHDAKAKSLARFVMGHSWGGYAAMVATNPVFMIKKCVSISGFERPSSVMMSLSNHPKNKPLFFAVKACLWNTLGSDGDVSACHILEKTKAKVLYIQGDEDDFVKPVVSGQFLRKKLEGLNNIRFIEVPGRKHNPYLSKDAEDYINSLLAQGITSPEGGCLLKMDLQRASNENAEVMKAIFDFFAE